MGLIAELILAKENMPAIYIDGVRRRYTDRER